MAESFKLRIVTPSSVYLAIDVESVEFTSLSGRIGVLAHHDDLIADVEICQLNIVSFSHVKVFAVSGGVFNFDHKNNSATLYIYSIESKEEIDIHRAMKAKENAETALTSAKTQREQFRLEVKLKRALNRINVKNNSQK